MPRIVGQTFLDEEVVLDGNRYVRCTFINAKLIFTATNGVSFEECVFRDCIWRLDGAAETTLEFLAALYHGLGREGQELVHGVMQALIDGSIGKRAIGRASVPTSAVIH